jgi:superoxide dismutase
LLEKKIDVFYLIKEDKLSFLKIIFFYHPKNVYYYNHI